MRKSLIVLAVLLVVTIVKFAQSEEHMKYSVIAFEYIGESDKPITPIVISGSKAGAEWFRTTVLKRGDMELTSVNVVTASQMKSLISDAEKHRGMSQHEQEKAQKPLRTISVTIVKSQTKSSFSLSTSAAVSMLDSVKTLCKDDQPLQSEISHFQQRILP